MAILRIWCADSRYSIPHSLRMPHSALHGNASPIAVKKSERALS